MSWLLLVNGGIISGVVLWYFKGHLSKLLISRKVKDDEGSDVYDPEEGGWQSDNTVRSSYSADSAYPRPGRQKSDFTNQVTTNYTTPRPHPVYYPPPQLAFPNKPQAPVAPPPLYHPPPPINHPQQQANLPHFPPPQYRQPQILPPIPQNMPVQNKSQHQWHQALPQPVVPKTRMSVVNEDIDPNELEVGSVLGGGSFGQVHRGKWHGTPVAVKILKVDTSQSGREEEAVAEFQREVAMLSRLRHPNICLFMGCCLKEGNHAIVTELVGRGSLWDVLREPKLSSQFEVPSFEEGWTWERLKVVATGIACGMSYLHGTKPQAVLHRDLKSSNILCDEAYCAKICDFGLSRLKAQVQSNSLLSTRLDQAAMTGNCGTIQWMAPEVLANQRYSETADVYSFGVILWELLVRKCPYEGMAQVSVALAVVQHGTRPPIPAQCPPLYRALIERCWAQDASRRPSFKHLLQGLLDDACAVHRPAATLPVVPVVPVARVHTPALGSPAALKPMSFSNGIMN